MSSKVWLSLLHFGSLCIMVLCEEASACRLCIIIFIQMCEPPKAFSCSLRGSLFCMLSLNSMPIICYIYGIVMEYTLPWSSSLCPFWESLTCLCQVKPLSADEKMGLPFLSGSSPTALPSSPSPFISEGTHMSHLKAYIDRYPCSYFSGPTNSLLLLSPLDTFMEPDFKSRNLSLFPSPTLFRSENYPFTQCSPSFLWNLLRLLRMEPGELGAPPADALPGSHFQSSP